MREGPGPGRQGARDWRLNRAAGRGDADAVRAAVRDGAQVDSHRGSGGDTPLIVALRRGHADVCRVLLRESGADVNGINSYGRTALFYAVGKSWSFLCRLLAWCGADACIKDDWGRTADIQKQSLSDVAVSVLWPMPLLGSAWTLCEH